MLNHLIDINLVLEKVLLAQRQLSEIPLIYLPNGSGYETLPQTVDLLLFLLHFPDYFYFRLRAEMAYFFMFFSLLFTKFYQAIIFLINKELLLVLFFICFLQLIFDKNQDVFSLLYQYQKGLLNVFVGRTCFILGFSFKFKVLLEDCALLIRLVISFLIYSPKSFIKQFYMATFQLERAELTQKPVKLTNYNENQQQKRHEVLYYENEQSEFMHPLIRSKQNEITNNVKNSPKVNKSVVLHKAEVEAGLTEIYNFYSKAYLRPVKQFSVFAEIGPLKMNMQSYFLFCKHFHILKAIFNIDKLTLIFKKHADYGKSLSFDNFYFMINSMSHQPEAKQYFHLQQMQKNLDVETAQELERQQFYNYLQIGSPERYHQCFKEIFLPFNMNQKLKSSPLQYHYRKFSLPQLRKKAIPEQKQKKKGQKDLFILKHDKTMQQNQFDQAKSIVVSWDSLRAKSVNNLGQPAELVQKKYLKADPEEDPYLNEIRPKSKRETNQKQGGDRYNRFLRGSKIEKKIRQIQDSQRVKNNKILQRIEKKLNAKSNRIIKI